MSDVVVNLDAEVDLEIFVDRGMDLVALVSECDPPYYFTSAEARKFAAELVAAAEQLERDMLRGIWGG